MAFGNGTRCMHTKGAAWEDTSLGDESIVLTRSCIDNGSFIVASSAKREGRTMWSERVAVCGSLVLVQWRWRRST